VKKFWYRTKTLKYAKEAYVQWDRSSLQLWNWPKLWNRKCLF